MRVLIVYAHPEPQSFNGALLAVAKHAFETAGHEVTVSDLYARDFNPVAGPDDVIRRQDMNYFSLGAEQYHAAANGLFAPDIATELERLMQADFLLLQFPLWWFSMPAMLKGWIDRVFALGSVYRLGQTWDKGLLAGRRAMLSVTTSAPAAAFAPDGKNGDMERILWPVHAGTLAIVGYSVVPPFVSYGIPYVGKKVMDAELERFAAMLAEADQVEPLFFHGSADIEGHRLRADIMPATPAQHRGPRLHMKP